MFSNRIRIAGIILIIAQVSQTFVLLTANIEDVKKIARKFVSEPMAQQIADFISKAAGQQVSNPNVSAENEQNVENVDNASDNEDSSKMQRQGPPAPGEPQGQFSASSKRYRKQPRPVKPTQSIQPLPSIRPEPSDTRDQQLNAYRSPKNPPVLMRQRPKQREPIPPKDDSYYPLQSESQPRPQKISANDQFKHHQQLQEQLETIQTQLKEGTLGENLNKMKQKPKRPQKQRIPYDPQRQQQKKRPKPYPDQQQQYQNVQNPSIYNAQQQNPQYQNKKYENQLYRDLNQQLDQHQQFKEPENRANQQTKEQNQVYNDQNPKYYDQVQQYRGQDQPEQYQQYIDQNQPQKDQSQVNKNQNQQYNDPNKQRTQNQQYLDQNQQRKENQQYVEQNQHRTDQNHQYKGQNQQHIDQNQQYRVQNQQYIPVDQNQPYKPRNQKYRDQNQKYKSQNQQHRGQNQKYRSQNQQYNQNKKNKDQSQLYNDQNQQFKSRYQQNQKPEEIETLQSERFTQMTQKDSYRSENPVSQNLGDEDDIPITEESKYLKENQKKYQTDDDNTPAIEDVHEDASNRQIAHEDDREKQQREIEHRVNEKEMQSNMKPYMEEQVEYEKPPKRHRNRSKARERFALLENPSEPTMETTTTPLFPAFNIDAELTTEKEKNEFDQYDNIKPQPLIATSGPVGLKAADPWWPKDLPLPRSRVDDAVNAANAQVAPILSRSSDRPPGMEDDKSTMVINLFDRVEDSTEPSTSNINLGNLV